MEEVDKQIAEKVIEKSSEDPTPAPVVEKPVKQKKPRSQKQQEAFAKARAKRLENIAKKNIEQETVKPDEVGLDPNDPFFLPNDEPPKPKKRGRGRPRGSTKLKKEEPPRPPHNYPRPVEHQIPQGVNHNIPQQPSIHGGFNYPHYYPPPTPQPAQIHNYYYGASPTANQAPPSAQETQKIKFEVASSSEEEEVEEPQYTNPEYIQEPEQQFKYRFA